MITTNLSHEYKSREELENAFMHFVSGGAIFIPTETEVSLGSEVNVDIKILNEINPTAFTGKVIWINPEGTSNNFATKGLGIQFGADCAKLIRKKIEKHLAD